MSTQREGGISWTEVTWNPLRGCRRVSAGCKHCYAERIAARFAGPGQPYEGLVRESDQGPVWTGQIRTVEHKLAQPLGWRRPRRIFVNSMSDLFHEDVPEAFVDQVFAVMALCPQHTFQVLTKRAERMRQYLAAPGRARTIAATLNLRAWPLPNVWIGVSIEDQDAAELRIPVLLTAPAAVRWLSVEPMLGPIDLGRAFPCGYYCDETRDHVDHPFWSSVDTAIDWVVVGGESGPQARSLELPWIRSLRDQCRTANVRFFVKQLSQADSPHFKSFEHFPPDLQVREYPKT